MTRLYICGPMTAIGPPTYGWPAFEEAAAELRAAGYDVVSPTEIDQEMGVVDVRRLAGTVEVKLTHLYDYEAVLARDLEAVATCDGVAALPGSGESPGAQREIARARELGLTVDSVFGWLIHAAGQVDAGAVRRILDRQSQWAEAEPLPPATIIGLTGYAQAGKDTTAGFLAGASYQRLAFADALKALAVAAGPSFQHLALHHIVDEYGWEYAKAHVPGVRRFLQDLGVGVREVLGQDTWVRKVMDQVRPGGRYVITDVRFPNEVEAIRAAGGVIVRVDRPGTGPANGHVSESFDGSEADYVLHNSGSLEYLELEVQRLLGILEVS